jgi:translocation and assembly module TamB
MLIPLTQQLMTSSQPFFKRILILCIVLSLTVTPQMINAASLLIRSKMSVLEMDLGNAILRVDKIDSKLAVSLNEKGTLTVSQFHAKYASLTFKPKTEAEKSKDAAPNTLPAKIKLPLPILLQDGRIDVLDIIQTEKTQVFKQISFNLNANHQSLQLGLNITDSPWGTIESNMQMENKMPFSLQGVLTVQQEKAIKPYQLKADFSGDLTQLKVNALHHFQPDNSDLQILPTKNKEQPNLIVLDATVSLIDQMPAMLDLQLLKIDASYLHPQLTGQLNMHLHAEGPLGGQQPMQVQLNATNSQINNHPLLLEAEATLRNFVLADLTLNAALATNNIVLSGGLDINNPNRNTLRWQANLPTLAAFMPGFAGSVNAEGEITQLFDRMHHEYQLVAADLDLPEYIHIDKINANGTYSSNETDVLATHVTVLGLSQFDHQHKQSRPINAMLDLKGSLAKHALTINIENTDALQEPLNLNSVIQGGLGQTGWIGQITSITSHDQNKMHLKQPAPISWHATNGFSLKQLLLQVQDGNIAIHHLNYHPAQATRSNATLRSKGEIQAFPVQAIQAYLGMQSSETEQQLSLNGAWDVEIDDQFNADISLTRASGDLRFFDIDQQKKQALGLKTLAFQLKVINNQITADATIDSVYAGHLAAKVSTSLTQSKQGFILNQQTPFILNVTSDLQHLNWITLGETDTLFDGKIKLRLNAHGTLESPNLTGDIQGQDLILSIPSQGIALRHGLLNATFAEQTLQVNQLHFDGKTGTLKAQGNANFTQRPIQLKLNLEANRFTALSRTDRFIVLSGVGDMHFNEAKALINGQFNVHHGLFELPKAGKPTLDDDIIIMGKQAEEYNTPIAIELGELSIDFGPKPALPYDASKQFILRGQGLNASLSGQIKLAGDIDQLEARGSLDVTGGYLAYGQLVNIETGQINFSGPIVNAGLNIVAMRNLTPTKVGVKLTGNIKAPQLQLISEPETTTDNKLSLLVLGQPLSEAGNSELAILSLAAGALLSQGESVPLQSKIADLAGLDSLDIKGNSNTDYSINAGKRINQRLMIGYEKSIFGLLNVAKLTYQLTQRIAIESKAGSENALDVVYRFSFD